MTKWDMLIILFIALVPVYIAMMSLARSKSLAEKHLKEWKEEYMQLLEAYKMLQFPSPSMQPPREPISEDSEITEENLYGG